MASVTTTSLKYTYKDNVDATKSKSFNNINYTVTNAQAQALGTALTTNDIYVGGIVSLTKIQKVSTTTDDIPLS